MKGTFHLLHGLPGSGKSTFAQTLRVRGRTIVLSNDAWMTRLYGKNPPADRYQAYFQQIESLQMELAFEMLAAGIDVVWDYGVWKQEARIKLKAALEAHGILIILYRMQCAHDVMMARVAQRTRESAEGALWIDAAAMRKFSDEFEPVSPAEGFEIVDVPTD